MAVSGTFPAEITKIASNGNITTNSRTVIFDSNGIATVTLRHGETLQINALPIGSTWTITETAVKGYTLSEATVNGTAADSATLASTVTGAAGTGLTGTLAGATATAASVTYVTVTNDYDADATCTVSVIKTLENRNFRSADSFTYTLRAVETDSSGQTIEAGPVRLEKDGADQKDGHLYLQFAGQHCQHEYAESGPVLYDGRSVG